MHGYRGGEDPLAAALSGGRFAPAPRAPAAPARALDGHRDTGLVRARDKARTEERERSRAAKTREGRRCAKGTEENGMEEKESGPF